MGEEEMEKIFRDLPRGPPAPSPRAHGLRVVAAFWVFSLVSVFCLTDWLVGTGAVTDGRSSTNYSLRSQPRSRHETLNLDSLSGEEEKPLLQPTTTKEKKLFKKESSRTQASFLSKRSLEISYKEERLHPPRRRTEKQTAVLSTSSSSFTYEDDEPPSSRPRRMSVSQTPPGSLSSSSSRLPGTPSTSRWAVTQRTPPTFPVSPDKRKGKAQHRSSPSRPSTSGALQQQGPTSPFSVSRKHSVASSDWVFLPGGDNVEVPRNNAELQKTCLSTCAAAVRATQYTATGPVPPGAELQQQQPSPYSLGQTTQKGQSSNVASTSSWDTKPLPTPPGGSTRDRDVTAGGSYGLHPPLRGLSSFSEAVAPSNVSFSELMRQCFEVLHRTSPGSPQGDTAGPSTAVSMPPQSPPGSYDSGRIVYRGQDVPQTPQLYTEALPKLDSTEVARLLSEESIFSSDSNTGATEEEELISPIPYGKPLSSFGGQFHPGGAFPQSESTSFAPSSTGRLSSGVVTPQTRRSFYNSTLSPVNTMITQRPSFKEFCRPYCRGKTGQPRPQGFASSQYTGGAIYGQLGANVGQFPFQSGAQMQLGQQLRVPAASQMPGTVRPQSCEDLRRRLVRTHDKSNQIASLETAASAIREATWMEPQTTLQVSKMLNDLAGLYESVEQIEVAAILRSIAEIIPSRSGLDAVLSRDSIAELLDNEKRRLEEWGTATTSA